MAVIIYPKMMNFKFMMQRPQQLMTEFGSRGHHVFFENLAPMTSQLEEAVPGVNAPSAPRPADLLEVPTVVYIGAWAYLVDHKLFAKSAAKYPDVQFISIGAPYGDIPGYGSLPNVDILGEKPHSE